MHVAKKCKLFLNGKEQKKCVNAGVQKKTIIVNVEFYSA